MFFFETRCSASWARQNRAKSKMRKMESVSAMGHTQSMPVCSVVSDWKQRNILVFVGLSSLTRVAIRVLGPTRGRCDCGECVCNENYSGDNCNCLVSNETCIAKDGVSVRSFLLCTSPFLLLLFSACWLHSRPKHLDCFSAFLTPVYADTINGNRYVKNNF